MKSNLTNFFAEIKSKNEKYEIRIGKPVNNRVYLLLNFNAMKFLKFVDRIDSHEYVNVLSVHGDGDTCGIAVELIKENSLSQLAKELPNDLYDFVENYKASAVIFKGEKE